MKMLAEIVERGKRFGQFRRKILRMGSCKTDPLQSFD
jgi:hypothetical protein